MDSKKHDGLYGNLWDKNNQIDIPFLLSISLFEVNAVAAVVMMGSTRTVGG
jgi:hypothetical protein